jgi:hypothetical protein
MSQKEPVIRKIIVTRETWDYFTQAADDLAAKRGIQSSPAEIAGVALDDLVKRLKKG